MEARTLRSLAVWGIACVMVSPALSDEWAEPVPMSKVNTPYEEWAPFPSFDGMSLYFSRVNTDISSYGRIYQAMREDSLGPFTAIRELSELNEAGSHILCPWVSPDNLRIYYQKQTGSLIMLMMAQRSSTAGPWAHRRPIYELNYLSGRMMTPRLTADELTIFFCTEATPEGQWDIWMATRPDRNAVFRLVRKVDGVNSSANDLCPSPSGDGFALYFASDRTGLYQVFKATRQSLNEPFDRVEPLEALDTPGCQSSHPCITADGSALYFMREGKTRSMRDLWVSYALPAKTYYVDAANGNDKNDGLTLQRAFATIQKGIDSTLDGYTIAVADGFYKGDGNRNLDFKGKAITLRSMNGPRTCVIDCENQARGFIFHRGEDAESVLEGFTITNGFADQGGAIYCSDSSPVVSRCILKKNLAKKAGSALFILNSAGLKMTNCILAENVSLTGGAIYCSDADPFFINCTFADNITGGQTGGIVCVASNPTLNHCILWGNPAKEISLSMGSKVSVTYCDVQGGWPGQGNFNRDPLLIVPINEADYHSPGLISLWRFNEAQGPIAYDSVGLNHGIIYGAEWSICPMEGALSFNGEDDYVMIPHNETQQIKTNQLSVSAWIKLTQDVGNKQARIICKHQANGIEWGFEFFGTGYYGCTGNQLVFHDSDGQQSRHLCVSPTPLQLHRWYHVSATDDAGRIRLYIDGRLEGSSDEGYGIPRRIDSDMYIGSTVPWPQICFFFGGLIDEVRLFDVALSSENIELLRREGYYYDVSPESPCIDAGDPSYLPTTGEQDIEGNPRLAGKAVDMGAYESNP
jgi:hypothetical protein